VDLAPLSDPDLVAPTLASTLGVGELPGRPLLESLSEYLETRELILILDNCEHLVEECARIAEDLLKACPQVRIVATSREALNIPGELVWIVPSLSTPPAPIRQEPGPDVAALLEFDAVRLFLSRAAAGAPHLTLTEDNAAAVADICRRLEGIPLAIELAAAQARSMPVEQIADRISSQEPFHLLTRGSRTAPARHQTLEATLDWSYTLLSEAEKAVLQRLSVFAGGCTLEAAEAVCNGPIAAGGDILGLLSSLVEKSLLVVEAPRGRARYHQLETIRQYAQRRLRESGAAEEVGRRHMEYFLAWAEKAEPHLSRPAQLDWLDRFEEEHDNVRTALAWSLSAADGREEGLRLAGAVARFWRLHGHIREGRSHVVAALAAAEGRPPLVSGPRALALFWAGELAYLQSDYPEARQRLEESLAIWRELGSAHKAGVAQALAMLGEVATELGDYATAPGLFEQSLAISRELDDLQGIGEMLMQLGWAAMRMGDHEQASARLVESLTVVRKGGNPTHLAMALSGMGEVTIRLGQSDRAVAFLEESLASSRAQGDKWGMGTTLGSLGWVALAQGDLQGMRSLLGDSLDLRMETGDRGGAAWCLEKLAAAAVLLAERATPRLRSELFQRASRIFGAAAAQRAPGKSVIDPVDQPEYERTLAILRNALGESPFLAAWEEGHAMPLAEAVVYALEDPVPPEMASSLEPARATKERYGGLTTREREVAALIAQGKSNREIAQSMVVGTRTVETYVTRILNKLGFDTRVLIATWAKDKGL
jgi:non-specific serine/threonine protein kinase